MRNKLETFVQQVYEVMDTSREAGYFHACFGDESRFNVKLPIYKKDVKITDAPVSVFMVLNELSRNGGSAKCGDIFKDVGMSGAGRQYTTSVLEVLAHFGLVKEDKRGLKVEERRGNSAVKIVGIPPKNSEGVVYTLKDLTPYEVELGEM